MTRPRSGPAGATRCIGRRRPVARLRHLVAVPLLTAVLVPILAGVASAAPVDDLPGHTGTFTVVDGILIFGVAPVGVFLLIALLVMRPGTAPKAQRYRPGKDWSAAPSWSGVQPAPEAPAGAPALPAPDTSVPVMDGVHDHAHADRTAEAGGSRSAQDGPEEPARGRGTSGGGAHGSW